MQSLRELSRVAWGLEASQPVVLAQNGGRRTAEQRPVHHPRALGFRCSSGSQLSLWLLTFLKVCHSHLLWLSLSSWENDTVDMEAFTELLRRVSMLLESESRERTFWPHFIL